jgi:lactoylglutathione lyase
MRQLMGALLRDHHFMSLLKLQLAHGLCMHTMKPLLGTCAKPLKPRQLLFIPRDEDQMRYLHTMIRVKDLPAALDFFCDKLGLEEVRRYESEAGRFTLVFLRAAGNIVDESGRPSPEVELTYNWDPEEYTGGRNFGHLAFEVDDIYAACERLRDGGVVINRPPRDGQMAFVRSPDGISVELLQAGKAKPPLEPWASMPNVGAW